MLRACGAGPGDLARAGWRQALRVGPAGWKDIVTWRTLRFAAGVLLPLAAGAASGHAQDGAFASLGALPAGLASFQGVTRTRLAAVAVASAGMAVSTFAGGTVAAAPWLLVPGRHGVGLRHRAGRVPGTAGQRGGRPVAGRAADRGRPSAPTGPGSSGTWRA